MGAEASKPVQKAASSALRKAGDNLNTLGFPVVHERIFYPPTGKPARMTVCRCWQSLKFPLCDNTHQRLQKQGINCGPVMLEIKAGATPVDATSHAVRQTPVLANLAGPQAAALGGACAVALASIAHITGVGFF